MFKNLPCNAGNSGSIPGQGTEIPYAGEQLGQHAATIEAHVPQGKVPLAAIKI